MSSPQHEVNSSKEQWEPVINSEVPRDGNKDRALPCRTSTEETNGREHLLKPGESHSCICMRGLPDRAILFSRGKQ